MNITHSYIQMIAFYVKKHMRTYYNLSVAPNEEYLVIPFDKLYKIFDLASRVRSYTNEDTRILHNYLISIIKDQEPKQFIPTAMRKTPYVIGFEHWADTLYLVLSAILRMASQEKTNPIYVKQFLNDLLAYFKEKKPAGYDSREVLVFNEWDWTYIIGGEELFFWLLTPKYEEEKQPALNWLGSFILDIKPLVDYYK